jgi:hypothetical protein
VDARASVARSGVDLEQLYDRISGTRGVLSIGAWLSIAGHNVSPDESRNSMVELGVNAAIIIALGATLRIMGCTFTLLPSPAHVDVT